MTTAVLVCTNYFEMTSCIMLTVFCLLVYIASISASGMDGAVPICGVVTVQSGGYQPDLDGIYTYVEEINGCPSYKHTLCPYYIYYVDKGSITFWLFGPSNGGAKGHIMQLSNASSPQLANDTWLSYDEASLTWTEDSNIVVSCNSSILNSVSPLAYWILNDVELTNDSSGNNLTLIAGYVVFVSDGVVINRNITSFLTLDRSPARVLEVSGDLSVTFWISPDVDGDGGVLQWVTPDSNGISSIGFSVVYIDNSISFFIGDVSVSNPFISTASNIIITSTWNYVAVTYSALTSTVLIYVNATQVWEGTIAGISDATAHTNFIIGVIFSSSQLPVSAASMNSMAGKMAHVGVYDVRLGQSNIEDIMDWSENVSFVEVTTEAVTVPVTTPVTTAVTTEEPVIIPAPIAYWTLQNPEQGTDIGSYTYNFTGIGVTFDSGPGVEFLGVDGTVLYKLMTNQDLLYFAGDMTLTFWLYPEATGGILQYSGLSVGPVSAEIGLSLTYRNYSIGISTYNINAIDQVPYHILNIVMENQWNHLAFAYDSNSTLLQVYVDSIMVWNDTAPEWSAATNHPVLYVGAWTYNTASQSSETLHGRLACLGMYNETFNEDQVLLQMESCNGLNISSPEASNLTCEEGCESSPCLHGSTCMDIGCGTYNCTCPTGYQGDQCECPDTFNYNNVTKTCIYIESNSTMNFISADSFCHTAEGHSHAHPAVINSTAENDFITTLLSGICNNGSWTSGKAINASSQYIWLTTNTTIDYQATTLPAVSSINGTECVAVQPDGSWVMTDCALDLCVVCQVVVNAVDWTG